MPIYVEILIRTPMEVLWAHTQDPALHQRWDLRFTDIDYLAREDPQDPQRFLYRTRMGIILDVSGEGESQTETDRPDGSRISSLKFGSSDPRSIIRQGSGYWKYIAEAGGIRFLTWYDYQTRLGTAGALFDRIVFRPLMGWATAWSFDRLRLWLEQGLHPAQALRNGIIHALSRCGLAFIFLYHGLVPKLLIPDPNEIAMLRDAGIAASSMESVLVAIGIAELAFAGVLLLFWRRRWPVIVCLALMALTTLGIAVTSPGYLVAAFNPITLNSAVALLAAIDLLVVGHVPSARRCNRRPSGAGQ